MTKEKIFWNWFKENEIRFFYLNQINDNDEKEKLLDDFLYHLHEYCDQLYFEMGGYPDEKQDLIITAEGNTDFFDSVQSLVNCAPDMEYWNVIAFKPIKEDFIIDYGGIKLDPNKMYFVPLNSKEHTKIDIRVYIDNYLSTNEDNFINATLLVLDNILGEKSNAIDIGYIEIEDLSSIPDREDLLELTTLPQYLEWKKSKRKN